MKKFLITASAYLLPVVAFAAGGEVESDNLVDLINQINAVINAIIPFLVGLAVLIIIWGVFNYISGAGDEEKRAQAKQYIVWGVVGVFIMLSIWGLVNVLVNSFDLKKTPLSEEKLPSFGGDPLEGTR
ncbi:MAG: pilin [bacterium]|nr:pilin [bacterium]